MEMDASISAAYRTHPVHVFSWLTIEQGYAQLARTFVEDLCKFNGPKVLVLDGFVGVRWDSFIAQLQSVLHREMLAGEMIRWLSTDACFRPANDMQTLLATSLTDDPVFGRVFHGDLQDLWAPEALTRLQASVEEEKSSNQITIVYGFGASCVTEQGIHVYIDVPKDRGQQLAGQQAICNVGMQEPEAPGAMYKRFYFVDWPMLNRVKRSELSHIHYFVDGTDDELPLLVRGDDFRRVLHELAQQPFRVKPWFAPGPWGGQWMKEQFGLPADQPNYAWSFELIAPENGILLGNNEQAIECSFDYLLWAETDAVLGVPVAARYGSYFPIRFDYLDTMGGTNLSCQVHPRVDYIRDNFGEPFTQDETYYIVKSEPDARVYLGLRDDADADHFHQDALAARDQGVPFDITRHVHSAPSQQHDLFLIPSGTVHCSGKNNLVLEISATPYIYTFKIYDYLRKDLAGNLRHVHLDHAFANLDTTRTASWIASHLCPQPVLLREEVGGKEYVIGNIEQLFFAIHRLEVTDTMVDDTQGKFQVLNLVEGERCELVSEHAAPFALHFAESVIIPASVGLYQVRNLGQGACKLVKAFVKG